MSNLTLEVLEEMMRNFPPPPPDPLGLSLFRPQRFGGLDVIVEPEIPTLKLSEEVAELVGPEFAAGVNAWLIARFGFREPVAKQPLLFGRMVVMNRRDFGVLSSAVIS
jgi:hypothetical protein